MDETQEVNAYVEPDEDTGTSMVEVIRRKHDTDMIKEYGQQLGSVLSRCKGDREREEVAKAFGATFRIVHKLQDGGE